MAGSQTIEAYFTAALDAVDALDEAVHELATDEIALADGLLMGARAAIQAVEVLVTPASAEPTPTPSKPGYASYRAALDALPQLSDRLHLIANRRGWSEHWRRTIERAISLPRSGGDARRAVLEGPSLHGAPRTRRAALDSVALALNLSADQVDEVRRLNGL
jgi:hypothetical protein